MDTLDGLKRDMDSYTYFSMPALSNSSIGQILRGENYFLENANYPPSPTNEMRFGSALHDASLLPDFFKSNYKATPTFNRRTKEGRELYIEFTTYNNVELTYLSEADFSKIESMKKRLDENELVRGIYDICEKEVSMFSTHSSGIFQKGRADLISASECLLADLKTTRDVSPKAFLRTLCTYGYDRQAAYYCDLATRITGRTFDTFIFIAIEKLPPYEIGVYSLDKKFLDRGRESYIEGMARFKKLLDMNEGSYDFSQFKHRFKNETVELLECPRWH